MSGAGTDATRGGAPGPRPSGTGPSGHGAAGAALRPAAVPAPRDTSRATLALLVCGIAGPAVFWALGFAAMASWPGYDPASGSISELIYARDGWLQVDAFILMAAFTTAFAVGMGRVAGATVADRAAVRRALLVLAAIEVGFALFPTDPDAAVTLHGALHVADLAVFAVAFPAAAFVIARILRRDPPWWRAGALTDAVAIFMTVAILGVALVLGGPLEAWTGILERIWVAVPSLWLVGLAAHGILVATGRITGRMVPA